LFLKDSTMGNPDVNEQRSRLVRSLLERVHKQSETGAERSPFWREGSWRCEFHNHPDPQLKVFRGASCVHEERVQNAANAEARSRELRRLTLQSSGADTDDCLLR
jgi:hypothetical protein